MSYQEQQRIQRALSQRMYLLDGTVRHHGQQVVFSVEGTTGNQYAVTICQDAREVQCTCPDFSQRGHLYRCKHIYFVLYRALRFDRGANPTSASILDRACALAQQVRAGGVAQQPVTTAATLKTAPTVAQKPYIGEDCAICYEPMTQQCTVTTCAHSCGNSVHSECFARWRVRNPTCVYCRAGMSN